MTEKRKKPSWMRTVIPFIILVIILITSGVIGWVLSGYCAIVSGDSMYPTLLSHDIIYGTKSPSESQLSYGSVIVIRDDHKWSGSKKLLVKRVIGLPGDTITITKNGLIRRNNVLIKGERAYTMGCGNGGGTITIPQGQVFVRGDNVNVSDDSRYQYCNGDDDYTLPISSIRLLISNRIALGRLIRE